MTTLERQLEFSRRFSDAANADLTENQTRLLSAMVCDRDRAVRSDEREFVARAFEGQVVVAGGKALQLKDDYSAIASFIRGLRG